MIMVILIFLGSIYIITQYSGAVGTKHIGGIVNVGLAVTFVHLVDLADDRWSLYNQLVHEQNMAVAIGYAGWIIGACIAFPSSIL